jgi:caa(3)-type oxidase subunit IV
MSGKHINYKKIYFVLLGLLVVSVAGPFLEIFWITMITAFGIALVKANLVIQNFMHLREEKRIVKWILIASLALMALFVGGVAPDVFRHEGQNWVNTAAQAAVARGVDGGEHTEEGAEGDRAEGAGSVAGEEHDEAAAGGDADHEIDTGGEVTIATTDFDAQGAFNGLCAACHGNTGNGNGPVAAAMNPLPANFTDPAFWAERDDERIFNVIKNGAASVGGSPSMAGWSGMYTDQQITALVAFIKTEFRP